MKQKLNRRYVLVAAGLFTLSAVGIACSEKQSTPSAPSVPVSGNSNGAGSGSADGSGEMSPAYNLESDSTAKSAGENEQFVDSLAVRLDSELTKLGTNEKYFSNVAEAREFAHGLMVALNEKGEVMDAEKIDVLVASIKDVLSEIESNTNIRDMLDPGENGEITEREIAVLVALHEKAKKDPGMFATIFHEHLHTKENRALYIAKTVLKEGGKWLIGRPLGDFLYNSTVDEDSYVGAFMRAVGRLEADKYTLDHVINPESYKLMLSLENWKQAGLQLKDMAVATPEAVKDLFDAYVAENAKAAAKAAGEFYDENIIHEESYVGMTLRGVENYVSKPITRPILNAELSVAEAVLVDYPRTMLKGVANGVMQAPETGKYVLRAGVYQATNAWNFYGKNAVGGLNNALTYFGAPRIPLDDNSTLPNVYTPEGRDKLGTQMGMAGEQIAEYGSEVKSFASDLFEGQVVPRVTTAYEGAKETVVSVGTGVKDMYVVARDSSAAKATGQFLSDAYDWSGEKLSNFGSWSGEKLSSLGSWSSEKASDLWNYLSGDSEPKQPF